MDLQLKDKVALITGGSRGIGRCTAMQFIAEGARVAICGRDSQSLTQTANELRQRGGTVAAISADVSDPASAKSLIEQTVSQLGGIDILINNVGNNFGGALMDTSEEDWRRTYDFNVFQIIRMSKLAAPHIAKRGGGAIVNIASVSGWQPALAGTWQYGSSKAAAIFATEWLALELARERIRANVVSPGSIIWEDGSWDEFRKEHPESFADYVRDGFPMGRLGKPEEVADVIVFLASPRSHWINGRNIAVDGCEQPTPAREFRGW